MHFDGKNDPIKYYFERKLQQIMICPKVLALLMGDKDNNLENLFTGNTMRKPSDELLEEMNKTKRLRKSKLNRFQFDYQRRAEKVQAPAEEHRYYPGAAEQL